jgi:signal transduction histidine kinase
MLLALCCAALFSLINLLFVYTVEDQFFYQQLTQEAARQQTLASPQLPASPFIQLYQQQADFPADLSAAMDESPTQREFAGQQGRHYHVLRFQHPALEQPLWLVTEVSQQLVVRPIRNRMLWFYAGVTLLMVVLAAAIGWWLSRRATRPLLALVKLVAHTEPLPSQFAGRFPDNEIGLLARTLEQAFARLQQFVERERAFSRDASHELRTPLSLIQSSAELLQLQADLSASDQQKVQTIIGACQQMTQLINTLLTLSREESVPASTQPVLLLPLLEQLIIQHRQLLQQQQLVLDLQVAAQLQLAVPAVLLQMILANLLQNACSHSLPGTVRIQADQQQLLISNPMRLASLPAEPAALFARGRHSSGYGVGLGIVQRLCQHCGIGLSLRQTQTESASQLEISLSWPAQH